MPNEQLANEIVELETELNELEELFETSESDWPANVEDTNPIKDQLQELDHQFQNTEQSMDLWLNAWPEYRSPSKERSRFQNLNQTPNKGNQND